MAEERITEQTIAAREEALQQRLARLRKMEEEVMETERAIKARESAKKSVLLRLPPTLYNKIAAWSQEDFRSVNGQIEYLLDRAVREKYKT